MAALWNRKLVRVALILLILLILVVVAARLLVPAEKIRDMAASQIAAATGAEVSLGEATVGFFPRLRVKVAEGRISGTGQALAAAAQVQTSLKSYQVEVQRFEVELALWPLLRRRIETGKVRLVGPRISLTTRAPAPTDGAASPTGAERPRAESSTGAKSQERRTGPGAGPGITAGDLPPPSLPWQLAVAGVEVRDGALNWREDGSSRQLTLEGWQQDLSVADMNLLLTRLLTFQVGDESATRNDAAEASLDIQTHLAELTLSGSDAESPVRLTDLRLTGTVRVPARAAPLAIVIDQMSWGPVQISADLEVASPARPDARLTGLWRAEPMQLDRLVKELADLRPIPEGRLGDWLAADPIRAGGLALEGSIDLPWPLPPAMKARDWLAALGAAGEISAARLDLPGGEGQLAASATLGLQQGIVALSQLVIEAEGITEQALGVTGELSLPLPGIEGAVLADLDTRADLALLQPYLDSLSPPQPDNELAPQLRWSGTLDLATRIDIASPPPLNDGAAWAELFQQGRLKGVKISGETSLLELTEGIPAAPYKLGKVEFASDLATVNFFAPVNHAAVRGEVDGKFTRLFPSPALELDLDIEHLDIDQLVAAYQKPLQTSQRGPSGEHWPDLLGALVSVAVAAAPAETPSTPFGERLPANLQVKFQGRAKQMILQKARYDRVQTNGRLLDKVLSFDSLSGKRDGGDIQGQGKIDYREDPHGRLSFTAEATQVPAGSLLAPYAPGIAPLWEGLVSASLSGGCQLRDKAAVLTSLILDGDAVSTNGIIKAQGMLGGISSYLGSRQDLKNIRFEDFTHHLSVADGRYHLKDLRLNGPDTDWWGEGWLGFDGGIDMQLGVKLPPGFKPELGDFSFLAENLRGEDDRIRLDLRLSGRAASPKVDLDLSEAKARGQDKLEDQLKDGVQGLLDKLKRK